jgi:hypothetical protein
MTDCGNEWTLKHGYFCQLPKGHAGDHESECPNPEFHQSWPAEPAAPVSPPREYVANSGKMVSVSDRVDLRKNSSLAATTTNADLCGVQDHEDSTQIVGGEVAPVSPPQSEKRAHQLLTELNNYALRHQKVIDASWIARVIEQVREEIGE